MCYHDQVASEYQGFVLDLYDIYVYTYVLLRHTLHNIKSLFPLSELIRESAWSVMLVHPFTLETLNLLYLLKRSIICNV
jgi:hypothetical protein